MRPGKALLKKLGWFIALGLLLAPAQGEDPVPQTAPPTGGIAITAQNADIRSVLLSVAQQAGLDLSMDQDVTGLVTLNLHDFILVDALDAITLPLGYDYELKNNFLRVHGDGLQTRLFTLNYITGVRLGTTQLSASSGSSGGSSSSQSSGTGSTGSTDSQSRSSVNSEVTTDPWTEIIAGLEMIVYGAVGAATEDRLERLVVHPASGVIQVTASYETLNRVASFLEHIEGASHRQVLIEARIVEVALQKEFHLGVDWSRIPGTGGGVTSVYGNDDFGVAQSLSPNNNLFQIAGSINEFDGLLDALGQQGDLRMISSPQVVTLSNQKAIIKVAREESFFTQRIEYEYQPDGSRLPISSVEPERITIGLILDVTPQIGPNGEIMMHVHPSLTEMVGEDVFPPEATGNDIQANAPILDIREVDTVVRIQSGHMLIIGGLTKERDTKQVKRVPLLGHIPLLGYLFSRTDTVKEQIEVVIMLKPTVIVGDEAGRIASTRWWPEGE